MKVSSVCFYVKIKMGGICKRFPLDRGEGAYFREGLFFFKGGGRGNIIEILRIQFKAETQKLRVGPNNLNPWDPQMM